MKKVHINLVLKAGFETSLNNELFLYPMFLSHCQLLIFYKDWGSVCSIKSSKYNIY